MNPLDDYLNKCNQYTSEFYKLVEIARCYNKGLCTLDELKAQVLQVSEAEYQRDLAYVHIASKCYCEQDENECLVCRTKRQLVAGTYPTAVRVPAMPSEPFELIGV